MVELIERVWVYSQNNPDGFTLNLETLRPVKFGIAVAYIETQISNSKKSLPNVISHALNHSKVVGGRLNVENGNYYFDSVKIFKNSELRAAIEFAKRQKQIVIFDLTNLRQIKINY